MAIKNQLAAKAAKQENSLSAYLAKDAVKNQINQIVGGKDGPRFTSSLLSAVQTNKQLMECTKPSLLSAALLGYSLNLSPSPQLGQYYMVPFNRSIKTNEVDERGKPIWKEIKEAQFIVGYKGLIQLAVRSGYYKKMNALPIKEGELIRYDPLNEEIEVKLIEDEEEREKAPTAGYFAMFEYTNGFVKTMYWSKQKMLSHADHYSQAFSVNATSGRNAKVSFADYEAGKVPKGDEWLYSSFWYKDFDGMAVKTMLRQIISKWGIMSIDMQKAFETDNAVIREDGTPDYVEEAEMTTVTRPEPEPETEPEQMVDAVVVETPQDVKPQAAAAQPPEDPQQAFASLEDEFFS